MKSSILFAVGSAVAWVSLTPATCRAQAEIDPDHFEMKNVESVLQPMNALTVNGKQARARIGDQGRRNGIHDCASRKAPGNDKSKDSFAMAISSCRSSASQPSKRVNRVGRVWKQARVTVNSSLSGGEASLPREALQPKP